MSCLVRVGLLVIASILGSTITFAQVIHRPIEDFTDAQVTVLAFYDAQHPERWAVVDFAGINYRWLLQHGYDLGSTFEGDVSERQLPDGRAMVHVTLHGRNVFMRGMTPTTSGLVSTLGCSRPEVMQGATPGLGEVLFTLDFINDAGVGAPLPDFPSILSVQSDSLVARGEGPLHTIFGVPEGTPGFLQMTRIALYNTGKGVPGGDFEPADHITIDAIGH